MAPITLSAFYSIFIEEPGRGFILSPQKYYVWGLTWQNKSLSLFAADCSSELGFPLQPEFTIRIRSTCYSHKTDTLRYFLSTGLALPCLMTWLLTQLSSSLMPDKNCSCLRGMEATEFNCLQSENQTHTRRPTGNKHCFWRSTDNGFSKADIITTVWDRKELMATSPNPMKKTPPTNLQLH